MNKAQILTVIKDHLDINPSDYITVERKMYYPQNNMPMATTLSMTERIDGLLADAEVTLEPKAVIMKGYPQKVTVMINGKRVVKTYSITRTLHINDGLHLEIFVEQYFDLYSRQILAIKSNSVLYGKIVAAIEQAWNVVAPIDDNILLQFLATSYTTTKLSPVQFSQDTLSIGFVFNQLSEDEVEVTLQAMANGTPIDAERYHCEINPKHSPIGLPDTLSNRGAGSASVNKRTFVLCTNLQKRGRIHVLNSDVELNASASFIDINGNTLYCMSKFPVQLALTMYNCFTP